MKTTPNLGLKKPDGTDVVDVTVLNGNADVLDTEVAKLASTTEPGRMSAADKAKLNGIAAGANNYTHPSSHPASIIAQDSSNRFVTDAEKVAWNAKASTAAATTSANGLMSAADKAKLDGVATGATKVVNSATNGMITINGTNQTVYNHPTGAGNNHIPSGGSSGNLLKWNGNGTASWATISTSDVGLQNGVVANGYDLNSAITPGFYRMGQSIVNKPSGASDWGQLLVMHASGDTITQIYGDFNTGYLFTRSGNPAQVGGSGSYQPWRRLLDERDFVKPTFVDNVVFKRHDGKVTHVIGEDSSFSLIDTDNTRTPVNRSGLRFVVWDQKAYIQNVDGSNLNWNTNYIQMDTATGSVEFPNGATMGGGKRILTQEDYNTLFQYANDGKTAVANAVTAKGVSAGSSDTFTALATKIGQIQTGISPVNLSALTSRSDGHLGNNHVVHAAFVMNVAASVVASATAYNSNSIGFSYVYVRKNGTQVGSSWNSRYSTQLRDGTIGSVVIDVAPGDTIDFVSYCTESVGYAGIGNVYITNSVPSNSGGTRTVGNA